LAGGLDRLSPLRITSELPTTLGCMRCFTTLLLVHELCFYYSHRLLHHPSIYPRVHKKHHEFTAPIALAAAYAHPIEHIVSNVGECGSLYSTIRSTPNSTIHSIICITIHSSHTNYIFYFTCHTNCLFFIWAHPCPSPLPLTPAPHPCPPPLPLTPAP
jgi:sterol desaturase/sphingolipid hydroxylase (fatty acid hydroxylase superfamily)